MKSIILVLITVLSTTAFAQGDTCSEVLGSRIQSKLTSVGLESFEALQPQDVLAKIDSIANEVSQYERVGIALLLEEGGDEYYLATLASRSGGYDDLYVVNPATCETTRKLRVYSEKN